MPVTYCRDCVYCVPTALAADCYRKPPVVVIHDRNPSDFRPSVCLETDFCGDGEAKPKKAEKPNTARAKYLSSRVRGDTCYFTACPGHLRPQEPGTCNCSQLVPRQTCINCLLVCDTCHLSLEDYMEAPDA